MRARAPPPAGGRLLSPRGCQGRLQPICRGLDLQGSDVLKRRTSALATRGAHLRNTALPAGGCSGRDAPGPARTAPEARPNTALRPPPSTGLAWALAPDRRDEDEPVPLRYFSLHLRASPWRRWPLPLPGLLGRWLCLVETCASRRPDSVRGPAPRLPAAPAGRGPFKE